MSQSQSGGQWELVRGPERLELQWTGEDGPGPVYVDFVSGALGYSRRVPGSRLLYRAVAGGGGVRTVIDATAGLGRDAFVLACKGYRVTALERSPVIAALLEDGLLRAMDVTDVRDAMGGRLTIVTADARQYLRDLKPEEAPDVVYMDPMFPGRSKSALVKKESIALRAVVGGDPDAGELLEAARAAARRFVVVKRMLHAPPIDPCVARSYRGKSTRYDVYRPARASAMEPCATDGP